MAEYIERERIEKFFDGIYDCADLTFEPNDHCCTVDDCAYCKWHKTMDAIRKSILLIPVADVRPVVRARWKAHGDCGVTECPVCRWSIEECVDYNFCPHCGADMRGGI